MKKEKDFKIWMVRAGRGSYLIEEFLNKGIASIGWNDIGAIGEGITYDDLKVRITEAYPDWSQGKINQTCGQIWRFYDEFQIGDRIVTYDSDTRSYFYGELTSGYKFNNKYEHKHYRKVDWELVNISRDDLKVESKNTLGSIMTIFEISREVFDDVCEAHPGNLSDEEWQEMAETQGRIEQTLLEQIKEDTVSRSLEFIKDIISNLNWEELESLAAGLMRAMGYKTRMTKRGSDLGSDILASPDGLAMVEPIIKVEVKHKIKSKEKVSAPDLRNFIGGLRTTTKGIYISSTGFTKEAHYEAERANFQVTLIDLGLLVELLVENYESLDSETKALVPLRKIYWPI